jgi:hypothetical protein
MSRQSRTASELEQMILAQVRANRVCPNDLSVRVIRVDGRWDAFPGPIDSENYSECLAAILRIASELRAEYDLAE